MSVMRRGAEASVAFVLIASLLILFRVLDAEAQQAPSDQSPEQVLIIGSLIHGAVGVGPRSAAIPPVNAIERPGPRDPLPNAPVAGSGGAPGATPGPAPTPGQAFRDCFECPEMVPIPAGSFTMGVFPGEETNIPPDRRGWASPRHDVQLASSFAVGKYEVTVQEYSRFVDETRRPTPDGCYILQSIFFRELNRRAGVYILLPGFSWRQPGYPQAFRHPVACVSWTEAEAYTAWLSMKTGKQYRLPSEAEWEYAARAGTTAPRFWQNSEASCAYANVADKTLESFIPGGVTANCRDGYWHTAPVGLYLPNAFGLYDTMGNVWEWTADCWNPSYDGAPSNGLPWRSGDCGKHIMRGGAYNMGPGGARLGYRAGDVAGLRVFDGGFRVARNME